MFEKLKNLKETLQNSINRPSFDPSHFNDPLAMSIQWTPIKGGGSNFGTHKLVEKSPNEAVFQATLGAKLFSFAFIFAGVSVPVFTLVPFQDDPVGNPVGMSEILFISLFGLVFAGVGIFMLRSYIKPVKFDKMNGYFWKGWKAPQPYNSGNEQLKDAVRLVDIHALQVISEYIRGDKKSYYSYELNLVLKNGERVNVIDHGNKNKVIEDANRLANFLGKPVWNAT